MEVQSALTLLCLLTVTQSITKLMLSVSARAPVFPLQKCSEDKQGGMYVLNALGVLNMPGLATGPRGHTRSMRTPAYGWRSSCSGNPHQEHDNFTQMQCPHDTYPRSFTHTDLWCMPGEQQPLKTSSRMSQGSVEELQPLQSFPAFEAFFFLPR